MIQNPPTRRLVWAAGLAAVLFVVSAPLYPATQTLQGDVRDEKGAPIEGAICTLTGPTLRPSGLTVKTGESGEIEFTGLVPGSYTLTCAAVTRQPVVKAGIEVTESQAPAVDVVLPPEVVVREKVEVKEKATAVTQESTTPPATLSAPQLLTLPLTEQKFKASLPLVPGVVRTPDGKTNIKGQVETQGMLLVDSAETVDPVTGSFAIDVPLDAIESVEVRKTAYQAEYGRFSGGLTSVQTKAPSSQWHFEVNDFLPTPRIKSGHIVGIADDKPRAFLTGPLWTNKLNFSEAATYDLLKQPVRGLAWPKNEIKTQGYNSFTVFQYIFSAQHLLTTDINVFPLRRQYADINSLVPQSASTDYAQQGYSVELNDQYLLQSGGALAALVKFTHFASNAHGQGQEDMFLSPDGRSGNFFNSWDRTSNQQEASLSYQSPRRLPWGQHIFKVGCDFVHRSYDGMSVSRPVHLLREDGTLAGQVDFSGPAALGAEDTEVAAYIQDHWILNSHLAFDAGFRYSGQTIGETAAFSPRVGLVYTPSESGRTIFRAGVGIFNDRVPLLAGDFRRNPTRTLRFFDAQGQPIGTPLIFQNDYVRVTEQGQHIIPPGNDLGSTPYNVTWNLEVNREIVPHVVARFSYLSSRTFAQFVINPQVVPGSTPILLLTNTGGSRYHEVETTLRVRTSRRADVNFSYVYSLARGDLNTLTSIYVPFEQPVIRPNAYADLPSNVPHRVVTWGRFRLPRELTVSPLLDVHTGFPYSAIDVLQNYVGAPNSRRFPTFLSLDLQLTKDFQLPFSGWLKKHKFRGEFRIYNLTNHSNPRDVLANVASPNFGQYLGFQHRLFDAGLDIVY
ncbi:MAG: TonB-dependent receptor [Acidobacteriia bacterium]|nr:TonB-dependent receptor [Terriglobia bacterium]